MAPPRHVRFNAVCPATRPGEHLRVVGEAEELGGWAPELTEVALTTTPSRFPLWSSAWVALPEAASKVEYKYVVCGGARGARWEGRPNRQLSAEAVPSGSTVTEVFDSREPPRIEAETGRPAHSAAAKTSSPPASAEAEAICTEGDLLVRFIATCGQTRPGQELRVVGSIGALGDWSPHSPSAVPLETSAKEFPTWRSGWVAVPPHLRGFEYKYVIAGPSGAATWEKNANRRLLPVAEGEARRGMCRLTITDEFGILGTGCLSEEWDSRPEKAPRSAAPPLPVLSKAVQESAKAARPLPTRNALTRNCASFCTVMQALENETVVAKKGLVNLRRRKTIGCITDLPEGLVPTKRSLGLQPAGGELEIVREACCTELAGAEDDSSKEDAKDTSLPRNLSDEATGSAFSEASRSRKSSSSPQTTSEDDSPASPKPSEAHRSRHSDGSSFCINEPEAEPERRPKAFEEVYSLLGKVGEGAFGVVYRCVPRAGGAELAVKVVNKDRLTSYALQALLGDEASGKEGEISLHRSLPPHAHVVGIHDCFEEPHAVRLVLDVCRGGDLFDAILRAKQRNKARCVDEALSEGAAASVTWQVLSALAFCHKHGVVHRDVKAENVLLACPEDEAPLEGGLAVAKLCDFGLAARCWAGDGRALRDPVGSPDYVAPEVARREAYGPAVDVWSSGVLLFASLRGRLPFPARTDQEALAAVKDGRVTYDAGWSRVAREAKTCVTFLMHMNPAKRPTAEEALEHGFLRRSFV